MGYEVLFKYKESTGEPGVYSDEIKEKTSKVGKMTEDVGLDVLAGKIMSQLARRNILIVDVQIYEYAKKKLNYRESSDGIVLKNKKFSFDKGEILSFSLDEKYEEKEEDDFKEIPSPSLELANKSCPIARKSKAKRPIRYEVYDPDPLGEMKVKQKGLKFTVGKKYPIYSEESLSATIIYSTEDDSSKEVKVSAEYFVAIGAGLVDIQEEPKYVGAENQKQEINLWGNYDTQMEMPDLRGR